MASAVTEDKRRLHVVPPSTPEGPQAQQPQTYKAHFHCLAGDVFK